MKVINQINVEGKKVLLRGDLDVAIAENTEARPPGFARRSGRESAETRRKNRTTNLKIVEDFRLKAMIPTLKFLLENKAKVILVGHLGRPKGKLVRELSLAPIADYLTTLGVPTYFAESYHRSEKWKEEGKILLLENLRFDKREEENDDDFARELASLADVYVNECFAASHRKHASIIDIPKYLPSFAGLQFAKETEVLGKILKEPARPLVFVMGGAKIETKIPLVKKISNLADTILLGGLLMFAQELEGVPKVRFPVDGVRIDDIGPKSIELFGKFLKGAKTIVWNGPLGRFEEEEFSNGTRVIAEILAQKAKNDEAKVIVGGGDTIAALDKFGLREKMTFVSTGGGAMLQFLADGTLPGLEALK